jgi:hypothetical protein
MKRLGLASLFGAALASGVWLSYFQGYRLVRVSDECAAVHKLHVSDAYPR